MTDCSAVTRFRKAFARNLRLEQVVAMEGCLRCGSCGEACAWFHGTREPRFHPQNRKAMLRDVLREETTREGRWLRRLGMRPQATEARIRSAMESFWQCTTCGRCSMACPLGLDNRSLFHAARRAYNESGLMQEHPVLAGIDRDTAEKGHSFRLEALDVFLQMGCYAAHQGIEIPLDVPGADYLFACSAVGNTRLPELGIQVPWLLNLAGVRYTLSSRILDTGTDVIHVTDNHELARAMLLALETEAQRLGAAALLISECGCDARTFFVESAQILGRPLAVPVRHLDGLLLEEIAKGNLPVRPVQEPVTFHDPCKFTRLAGLGGMGRELLRKVATDVREMASHGERSLCCNGGSGPLRLPEQRELRRRVSREKVGQIRATGAARVVTPCAVCMLTLRDLCEADALAVRSMMMFELVAEAVRDALGSEQGQGLEAPILRGMAAEFRGAHGLEGFLRAQPRDRRLREAAARALANPAVARYASRHPGAETPVRAWLKRYGEEK